MIDVVRTLITIGLATGKRDGAREMEDFPGTCAILIAVRLLTFLCQ